MEKSRWKINENKMWTFGEQIGEEKMDEKFSENTGEKKLQKKLPFVAKSCHLLPKVAKSYHLLPKVAFCFQKLREEMSPDQRLFRQSLSL